MICSGLLLPLFGKRSHVMIQLHVNFMEWWCTACILISVSSSFLVWGWTSDQGGGENSGAYNSEWPILNLRRAFVSPSKKIQFQHPTSRIFWLLGEHSQRKFRFLTCFWKRFCTHVKWSRWKILRWSFFFTSLNCHSNLPDFIPGFLFTQFYLSFGSALTPLLTYFLSPLPTKSPSYLNCRLN